MAAALLPGLLLLALSLGFPLASADKKTLPLGLPSTVFLKPSQNSTNVTFTILIDDTEAKKASVFPLGMQWYAAELFRNDDQNVVLRLSHLDEEFTCSSGQKLMNYHASYEGHIEWSDECPKDVPEELLGLCPTIESTTSDSSDRHVPESSFSPAPRHQTSTSTASDSGNSTAKTEDLDGETKKILWIALPVGTGVLLVLAVSLVCFLHTNSREYQPPTDGSDPANSGLDNGVASEEEESV